MKFTKTDMTGMVEFLAADEFVALPYKATANKKQGAYVEYDGVSGLCLYAITKDENPNGAMLVEGVVDEKKLKALSGETLTTEQKGKLPRITFRNNIGVNA